MMNSAMKLKTFSLVALMGSGLLTTGCATKKYVRNTVDPVNTRVGQVEKRTTDNEGNIQQVGQSASRANERAATAEKAANDAGQAASRANDNATQAGQKAGQAVTMAQQNSSQISSLQTTVNNLDNFQVAQDVNVLFPFGKAELTREGREQLDTLGQSLAGMKRYEIEVEGFTDKAGGKNYNLTLSQRRAEAVVRYLTTKYNAPLRDIHVLGMGVDTATSTEASRREARKQNRRVQVKVYQQNLTGQGGNAMTTNTTTGAASTMGNTATGVATTPATATPAGSATPAAKP